MDSARLIVIWPFGYVATMLHVVFARFFCSRSIFEFCNSIGTFRTWHSCLAMSVHGGKADLTVASADFRV